MYQINKLENHQYRQKVIDNLDDPTKPLIKRNSKIIKQLAQYDILKKVMRHHSTSKDLAFTTSYHVYILQENPYYNIKNNYLKYLESWDVSKALIHYRQSTMMSAQLPCQKHGQLKEMTVNYHQYMHYDPHLAAYQMVHLLPQKNTM